MQKKVLVTRLMPFEMAISSLSAKKSNADRNIHILGGKELVKRSGDSGF